MNYKKQKTDFLNRGTNEKTQIYKNEKEVKKWIEKK